MPDRGRLRRPGRGLIKIFNSYQERINDPQSNQNIKSNRATPESVTMTGISGHVHRNTQVVQAHTELELRCGDALILLSEDGHIQIRGGSVQIN
jgi:hypothetical protein